MVCCILQIGARVRINDANIEYKRLIVASGVAVEDCPCFRYYVHSYRIQATVLSSRFLSEGPYVFNNKVHITFAKGSSQCLVEHLILGKRAPFRLCPKYSLEAGGFLPAIIATTHLANKYHGVMQSQAPA